MQHDARTVDGGDMRLRQTATVQTTINTILKVTQQLDILIVVQMKPVCGAAGEYDQLQVIIWLCA
jgi:hypothetical protein